MSSNSCTFIEQLIEISNKKKYTSISKKNFNIQKTIREEELFKFLTDKYHKLIKDGITDSANKGKREKYINFDRNDFKANFPSLGYPNEVQKRWLEQVITNPSSSILPMNESNDIPDHLNGLHYEIWNNKAFTTYFSW
tara:strand:- start:1448 stop:1861 length:414 start_codon:yes stop_codon:yes gene_type:complete